MLVHLTQRSLQSNPDCSDDLTCETNVISNQSFHLGQQSWYRLTLMKDILVKGFFNFVGWKIWKCMWACSKWSMWFMDACQQQPRDDHWKTTLASLYGYCLLSRKRWESQINIKILDYASHIVPHKQSLSYICLLGSGHLSSVFLNILTYSSYVRS